MQDTTRYILLIFVEKAHKLRDSRFLKLLEEDKLRAKFTVEDNEVTIEAPDLDQEAVDAFILTFRFFIQKNESISLYKLDEINDPLLSSGWKHEVTLVRQWFETYLSEPPSIVTVTANTALTRKQILDTFIYGDLSHLSKRSTYEEWKEIAVLFSILQFQFYAITAQIVHAICHITAWTEQELANTHHNPPAQNEQR